MMADKTISHHFQTYFRTSTPDLNMGFNIFEYSLDDDTPVFLTNATGEFSYAVRK